jgi:hypothetical protein
MLELIAVELELKATELALETLELEATELAIELGALLAAELAAELAGGVTDFEPPPPPQAETKRLKATKEMRLMLRIIIPLIVC